MSQKAVILSAPSGSGKTTIVKHLLGKFPELTFSISATTRPSRPGEVHGRDYFFLGNDEFRRGILNGEFIEYEEVYGGSLYGTLRSEVDRIWEEGKVVIFDVDVVGGSRLKEYLGEKALAIFIRPPSLEVLAERLRGRGTESELTLEERLGKAAGEMEYESLFDRSLINDDLETALKEAEGMLDEFIGSS